MRPCCEKPEPRLRYCLADATALFCCCVRGGTVGAGAAVVGGVVAGGAVVGGDVGGVVALLAAVVVVALALEGVLLLQPATRTATATTATTP
jgi:hypothetical protein